MAFKYSIEAGGEHNGSAFNRTNEAETRDNNVKTFSNHATTSVELYTTIVSTVFLFSLALIGIIANTTLLLSARLKRNIRNVQYGLYFAVGTVNLVFCGVWLPIHTVQIIINFHGHGAHLALCLTNVVIFNLCLAMLVFLTFFLAIQRLYQLSALPMQNLRKNVTRGIVVSFSIGCISALAMAIEFPWNIDYKICLEGVAHNVQMGTLWFSVAAILTTVIYSLLLLLTMLILWIATLAVRHKIAQMMCKPESNCYGDHLTGGVSHIEMSETDASHAKSLGSVTFEQTSGATISSRKESISEENQLQSLSQSQSRQLVFVEPKKTDKANEGENYDLKMRISHQKSGSGRRHTVANIGLGDSFLGFGKRRGSLEDNRPKANYNYVRKWSVDITALQAQLENPKAMGRSMPFGEIPSLKEGLKKSSMQAKSESISRKDENFSESIAEDSIAEQDEVEDEEEEEERGAADIRNEQALEDKQENNRITGKSVNRGHVKIQENNIQDTDIDEPQDEPQESDPLAEPTPAIVVNGNSPHNHGNRVDFVTDNEDSGVDAETLQKFHTEVIKTNKCILLQLITLVCILPYTIMQLLQPLMESHLNRNLTYICMGLSSLMSVIQPIVMVWMDQKLQIAVKKLHHKITHWRCVCYCNIGKGKKCFSRPHDLEPVNPATTVIG